VRIEQPLEQVTRALAADTWEGFRSLLYFLRFQSFSEFAVKALTAASRCARRRSLDRLRVRGEKS
jgi:hypothetical protein